MAHKNDLGKDEKSRQSVFRKKFKGIVGIDGLQDSRHGGDRDQPRYRQTNKPDQHNRSEDPGDFIRSPGLNGKKSDGNRYRNQDQNFQPQIFQAGDKQYSFHGG